jgi:hypothetical protein
MGKKGDKIYNLRTLLQQILGLGLGFFFQTFIIEKIVDFVKGGGAALPEQIPLWTGLLLAGGTAGLILFFFLIFLALGFVGKILLFFKWMIIGIILAFVYKALVVMVGFPDFFSFLGINIF